MGLQPQRFTNILPPRPYSPVEVPKPPAKQKKPRFSPSLKKGAARKSNRFPRIRGFLSYYGVFTHNQRKMLIRQRFAQSAQPVKIRVDFSLFSIASCDARFDRCLRRPIGQSKPMNFVPDGVHRMFQLHKHSPREDLGYPTEFR